MEVIHPFTTADVSNSWKSLWNKVIDRTVVPLSVNYTTFQVGIGTVEPKTYIGSALASLVVSGGVYVTGMMSATGGQFKGNITASAFVGAGDALTYTNLASGTTSTKDTLYANNIIKAWVSYATTGGAIKILDSFNVTGVTYVGVGQQTVNFGTGMLNQGTCVQGFGLTEQVHANTVSGTDIFGPAFGTVRINTRNGVGTLQDVAYCHIMLTGRQ